MLHACGLHACMASRAGFCTPPPPRAQALEAAQPAGTKALRSECRLPQATYHVLKAALHLLGRQPTSFDSWPKAQALVGPQLFEQLAAYDCRAPRDMAAWAQARACYKAVKSAAGGPVALLLAAGGWAALMSAF